MFYLLEILRVRIIGKYRIVNYRILMRDDVLTAELLANQVIVGSTVVCNYSTHLAAVDFLNHFRSGGTSTFKYHENTIQRLGY